MRSLIIGFILLIGLSCANISRVEKNQEIRRYNISTANFTALCQTTKKTILANEIYVALARKAPNSAFYYGCDSTGRKKINIALERSPDQTTLISFNVLIEGDVPTEQAQIMANELVDNMRKVLSEK